MPSIEWHSHAEIQTIRWNLTLGDKEDIYIYIYIYIFLAKNTIFKLFKNSILQDRYASIEDGRIEIIYYKSEKQVYSFKLIRIIF